MPITFFRDCEPVTIGSCTVWLGRVAPDVMTTSIEGKIDKRHAQLVMDFADEMLRSVHTIRIFHEWSGMTGYDVSSRLMLTHWCLKRRSRLAHAGIVTTSSFVTMGLAVANSILGNMLVVYPNAGALLVAVHEALRAPATDEL